VFWLLPPPTVQTAPSVVESMTMAVVPTLGSRTVALLLVPSELICTGGGGPAKVSQQLSAGLKSRPSLTWCSRRANGNNDEQTWTADIFRRTEHRHRGGGGDCRHGETWGMPNERCDGRGVCTFMSLLLELEVLVLALGSFPTIHSESFWPTAMAVMPITGGEAYASRHSSVELNVEFSAVQVRGVVLTLVSMMPFLFRSCPKARNNVSASRQSAHVRFLATQSHVLSCTLDPCRIWVPVWQPLIGGLRCPVHWILACCASPKNQ
jgi:hypothetical protein